jgi:AcrR family transcriptional regulator
VPKVVDHGERREELAGAVWRVILRDGIEGVSIRTVAAEVGLSTGALRHYFRTKEALLAGADRLLAERVIRRLERRPRGGDARQVARGAILEVLPLDGERRTEAAVWFAFTGRSFVDGRVSREHRNVFDGTRELCLKVVHDLDAAGELKADLDLESEARRLHVLIDGLVVQALMGRLGAEEMLGVLDAHLDEISR